MEVSMSRVAKDQNAGVTLPLKCSHDNAMHTKLVLCELAAVLALETAEVHWLAEHAPRAVHPHTKSPGFKQVNTGIFG